MGSRGCNHRHAYNYYVMELEAQDVSVLKFMSIDIDMGNIVVITIDSFTVRGRDHCYERPARIPIDAILTSVNF